MNWANLWGYYTIIDDESSVCLTVDNTPPDITGSVSANPIKSGNTLKIKAFIDLNWYTPNDTANITATIFGKNSTYHF